MPILDAFERKGLFRVTRILALFIIGILVLGIGSVAIYFSSTLIPVSQRVKPQQVIDAIKEPARATGDPANNKSPEESQSISPDIFPGLKIPFPLQGYFSRPQFRQFMQNKLSDLSLAEQQAYVEGLSETVLAAKSSGIAEETAIDTYVKLRDVQVAKQVAQNAERAQKTSYFLSAVGSAVALIGLFSLILVLLAIERNSRTSDIAVVK